MLAQKHLNYIIYIKHNQALKRIYNELDNVNLISLKDIDENNKWFIREIEDGDPGGGAEQDIVFDDDDDDDLTWGDVVQVTRAEKLGLMLEVKQGQRQY